MIILYSLIGLYLLFYGTLLFYIAFMHIKEHREEVKPKIGVLWYGLLPFFIIALAMDALFNAIIGTLVFRELPREWLFTARCQRHLGSTGRKLRIAHWFCTYLLNPFDSGHCS